MRYLSVTEIAKKWDVSERSVRENTVRMDELTVRFLPARLGTFLKMCRKNRSVPTRKKNSQLLC